MADGTSHADRLLDTGTIAQALGRHKSNAERRALRERWPYSESTGLGGKRRLYALADLPMDVQAAIVLATRPVAPPAPCLQVDEAQIRALWRRYESVPQKLKDVAGDRLNALLAVQQLVDRGTGLLRARGMVAQQLSQHAAHRTASEATLSRWAARVEPFERQHWKAALVPSFVGRQARSEIPPEAWDSFKADYLRLSCPTASSCYARLCRVAERKGWVLPAQRTFERRIAELPRALRILMRQGQEALDRTFPAQDRDRAAMHALEWVNADGHKFDVFVRTPMGEVVRPIMVGVQDLYSNKILGYRMAETESADLARMAFRDAIAAHGIPHHALLDNGRAFASKMMTGGVANRFRFKVRHDDPTGVLVGMGIQIHWATPYHGQAKPIERAWRDLCDRIARHPAFEGAYTGNKPEAKPENYASRAIAWDEFARVVAEEIAAHNARAKRRTAVCGGIHSFDDVFAASYAQSTICKATPDQLRELLLAAEVVTASQYDGSVKLAGNRYWTEALAEQAGRKLLLRFDPDALQTEVQVYTLANVFLGTAPCRAAVGFADTGAAREHLRAKKDYRRAVKKQRDAEVRMSAAQVAAQLPSPAPAHLPEAGVIAPMFGTRASRAAAAAAEPLQRTGTDDACESAMGDLLERIQQRQNAERGWTPPAQD